MNCKRYRAGIEESDFAAAGREAARFTSHADGCAECRAYGDETAAVRGLVAGLARVDAPADFEFRLRARMSAADAARTPWWSRNLLPRAAWLGAAGCLALAAALALQTRDPRPTEARRNPAQPAAERTTANPDTTANPVTAASADASSRPVSGETPGEVPAVELTTSSPVSNQTVETRRRVRDASVASASAASASVASASAAKLSQRRLASAAAAAEAMTETAAAAGGARDVRTETNTLSMRGSTIIVAPAIPLPVSADERPLQVLFKDTQGTPRVVNVDPVAFGSNDPAARPSNVTFTKAAKKQGVW